MKKIYLIKNPCLFQGEKNLKKNKNYFEGWYFKNIGLNDGISFIPGISINEKEKRAFIQVITKDSSYYVNYDINDFKFNEEPFYIKIDNNFFSKDVVFVDIKDNDQGLIIYGKIEYSNSRNIATNIMGPFSYVPFMECNHAIISMRCNVNGVISINNRKIKFYDDIGYIEKDWGCSFPQYYIWCQGNNFKKSDASFMISIANIPFKIFHFKGVISSLIIDNKEYRFATYNGTKIIKYDVGSEYLDIILKRGHYYLNVQSKYSNTSKLIAPVDGKMERNIFESIAASISVTLKKDNKIIFCSTSENCGLEIVRK